MPRLLRPAIPLSVKLRVLLRQLGDAFPDEMINIAEEQGSLGLLVHDSLQRLAVLLGCDVKDLRLDHDPALGSREKVFKRGIHVGYRPDANDPEHLIYRTHADHLRKTNLRGDGAQHPDRVLIKKQRRREREAEVALGLRKPKPKAKIAGRSNFPEGRKLRGRPFQRRAK